MALGPFSSQIAKVLVAISDLIWSFLTIIDYGDLPTWFAGIGTIGTLGVLMYQNLQLKKEQKQQKADLDEERQKRESHEQKQQEMWQLQAEITNIHKYDAHKRLFINELKGLEERFGGLIGFPDKEESYNRLFPENDLTNCELRIDLTSSKQVERDGSLSDCLECYSRVLENISEINEGRTEQYYLLCSELCTNLWASLSRLGIKINTQECIGYIYKFPAQPFLIINIFDIAKTVLYIHSSLERICSFAHIEMPVRYRNHVHLFNAQSGFMQRALLGFALRGRNLRGFRVDLGNRENELRCMYKCYEFFCYEFFLHDICVSKRLGSVLHKHGLVLQRYFTNHSELLELLSSEKKIHELLNDFIDSLKELNNNSHVQQLVEEINDIINLDFSDAV